MKTPTGAAHSWLFVLAILLAALTVADAAGSAALAGGTPGVRIFVGEYKWFYQDQPGPLRAEFTATGKDRWDVLFHFRFDGRDRTYLGSAEGSLSDGGLKGKVRNENRRRTFIFEADVANGHLQGTHRETTPSRARRTGTLTLIEEVAGS